ncbi:IS1478 transposase [Xanthomonas fragariae LMG 25863]|nr:IS1478 transposase [Xanthomonas fragariae LMG 25863]
MPSVTRLKGAQGDALHVLGCAAGYNLRCIAFLYDHELPVVKPPRRR